MRPTVALFLVAAAAATLFADDDPKPLPVRLTLTEALERARAHSARLAGLAALVERTPPARRGDRPPTSR